MDSLDPDERPATAVDTHAQAAALTDPPLVVRRPLEALLDRHGIGSGPVEVTTLGEGESNVTLSIRRDGLRAVLRRPPRSGPALGRSDVLREARLLELLGPTAARAPRLLLACPDASVIGAPFYVMEEVSGAVISSAIPAQLDRPGAREAIADELVDALVELHALVPEETGLSEIGRPADFLIRHLRRWAGVWERHRTREIPVLDEVTRWLQANLPHPAAPATLVHGDYRLANVVFVSQPSPRLTAVLDWELATLGDPLCDLAWMLTT